MALLDGYLDIPAVTKELNITERTLFRWEAEHVAPPRIKLGKRNKVLYRREAVEKWMRDGGVEGARERLATRPRAGRAK